MSEENSLGEMLNTAIRRMGWTHQQVADKFDQAVNRVTVSRWVGDSQRPSDYHLKQLVDILGFSEEEAYALFRAARLEPPRKHNLSSRNRLFTGRENCLELVANLFKTDTTVALSGLPGIGKTQLALEYAHRCDRTQVYSAVLWVNADKASLQSSYADLAEALQLPAQDDRELYRRVQAVTQWLKRHTNWLLIMDNADDLELARSFFPYVHRGHILLTTRTQIVGGIARQIEIVKMAPEEAQLFLLRRSRVLDVKATLGTVATNVREAARQIVELLDGHPLALDQAGAFIEDGGSFTTYKDLYEKQRRDLLDRRGSLKGADCDYPVTVAVTFALCFNKARTQHPLADDILNFCAFLHPDAIPDELFQHDDSFNLDTLAFTDGITALLQYSLITRNTQDATLSLHRLVQAVLIDDMPPDLRKQWRDRVVRTLQAALSKRISEHWLQRERLVPHVLACAAWANEISRGVAYEVLFDFGLFQFGLFNRAAAHLIDRGQYSEAEVLLSRALLIRKQLFGAESLETASSLDDLADVYVAQGKYSQAEHSYQQALEIQEKIYQENLFFLFGRPRPDLVDSMHCLALLYLVQGKPEQAEPLLVRQQSILEMELGIEHADPVVTLTYLVAFYIGQGKEEQFAVASQRLFKIWETYLHGGHYYAFVDQSVRSLAALLHLEGKHEQADAFYQHILRVQKRLLGAAFSETQKTKKDYASFLRSTGRDPGAATLEADEGSSV